MQRAMETAGPAVVFSGVTVAIGLVALVALRLPFLRSMGYGGLLIPLVAMLAAITLLPVVLAKLGPRLDWPQRRTDDRASRAWTRWARAVTRRRWVAAWVGMTVMLALAFAATGLQLGTSDADAVARPGDAKEGLVAVGGQPAANEAIILTGALVVAPSVGGLIDASAAGDPLGAARWALPLAGACNLAFAITAVGLAVFKPRRRPHPGSAAGPAAA